MPWKSSGAWRFAYRIHSATLQSRWHASETANQALTAGLLSFALGAFLWLGHPQGPQLAMDARTPPPLLGDHTLVRSNLRSSPPSLAPFRRSPSCVHFEGNMLETCGGIGRKTCFNDHETRNELKNVPSYVAKNISWMAVLHKPVLASTRGRGVKFTSARVLVRAPIDGPGFPMRTARARRKLRNSSESLLHVGGQRHQTHVRLLQEKRRDFEVVLLETAVLSMEKISMICSTSRC